MWLIFFFANILQLGPNLDLTLFRLYFEDPLLGDAAVKDTRRATFLATQIFSPSLPDPSPHPQTPRFEGNPSRISRV